MNQDFDRLLDAAKRWARESCAAGWLTEADIAPLTSVENRSPASLFEPGEHRPLVVAFFGGTGVGKSSLLNRLAGQPIAKVGVERPTSREVSIYLHESFQLRQLPEGFPVERVRVARHNDGQRRQVLWIDMPDIDSTESSNRDLVAEWLPHVDVLIYVVSPERYRDDKGWRLLREHVREHAWLFVMNQWDRAQEAQVDDFIKLLRHGGFANPLVFRTDCRERIGQRKPDGFVQLESAIQSLADSHLIEQLEMRAMEARLGELLLTVSACLGRLGDESSLESLRMQWKAIWDEGEVALLEGLQWPMAEVARSFVNRDANPLRRSVKLEVKKPADEGNKPATPSILWDDWAQMQLQDAMDKLLVEAGDRGLPITPIKSRLSGVAVTAPKVVTHEAQRGLRLALANPGNAAQRFLLKFTAFCSVLLPLAAMGWVTWQAVTAYYASALTHTGFLGTDFAIHSILLVAIAWLLPYFINRQIKPSNERVALRGLRNGVGSGLAQIQSSVETQLEAYAKELGECAKQGKKFTEIIPSRQVPLQGMLERMIADE